MISTRDSLVRLRYSIVEQSSHFTTVETVLVKKLIHFTYFRICHHHRPNKYFGPLHLCLAQILFGFLFTVRLWQSNLVTLKNWQFFYCYKLADSTFIVDVERIVTCTWFLRNYLLRKNQSETEFSGVHKPCVSWTCVYYQTMGPDYGIDIKLEENRKMVNGKYILLLDKQFDY